MYQALVGQGHFDFPATVFQHALAAQARVEAGVAGPVYKVFFFISQFRQVAFALVYIQVASAAGAYHAAVVVQFYIILQGYFQYADARLNIFYYYWFQPFLFKLKFYAIHYCVFTVFRRKSKVSQAILPYRAYTSYLSR